MVYNVQFDGLVSFRARFLHRELKEKISVALVKRTLRFRLLWSLWLELEQMIEHLHLIAHLAAF